MTRQKLLSCVAAVALALGAVGCNEPRCRLCGFTPGVDVLVTYSDGSHATTHADSHGCVSYRCGRVRELMQLEGRPIVMSPPVA